MFRLSIFNELAVITEFTDIGVRSSIYVMYHLLALKSSICVFINSFCGRHANIVYKNIVDSR
jgi:hypothetical protein